MPTENPSTWIPLLQAVATFTVAFIALFRERILFWWHGPVLELTISPKPPDCQKYTDTHYSCYYFRCWVENTGGMTATNVRVFEAKLQQKNSDGGFRDVSSFLPSYLEWTQSHKPVVGGIAAKMGQHCELGVIYDVGMNPQNREAVGLSPLETCFEIEAVSGAVPGSFRFGPGTYRLHLRAAAENSKRVDRVIEIELSGQWYEDEEEMLGKGISLRMV